MSTFRAGPIAFEEYQNRYPNLAFERRDGVLLVTMHDGSGGRMLFGGDPHPHAQITEAFYDIARDNENRAVILTGAGGAFIDGINFGEAPPKLPITAIAALGMDTESVRFLMNQVNVPVPMIAAVDGPAHVQSQLALLCDIAIGTPTVSFGDVPHYEQGLVPGDGAHIVWPMYLGPGRLRYFLMTGQKILADEALALGLIQEIVEPDKLIERAFELARLVTSQPPMTARLTRLVMTQEIKKRLIEDLPFGLTAEVMAFTEHFPNGIRK